MGRGRFFEYRADHDRRGSGPEGGRVRLVRRLSEGGDQDVLGEGRRPGDLHRPPARFLGGPFGIVLTGASIASLGALYARNHRKIWAQKARYESILGQYRIKHQQVRTKYVDGAIDDDERKLMVDGLLRRFLDEIDEPPELPEAEAPESDEEE